MSVRERITQLLSEIGDGPKKSLGQNFLISDHVIEKIVKRVELFKPQNLIEIGPGLGSLTEEILKFKSDPLLIELDHRFAQFWRQRGLEVVEADALQVNWKDLVKPGTKSFLVSNLPYQISSSLVIDRCLDENQLSGMVLMFQKEVAQKIRGTTETSTYGMLSVIAQTFWKIDLLLEASSGDFMPPPKVASRVLVFVSKPNEIKDRKRFLRFLKAAFSQPRKMMISNLASGLQLDKPLVQATLIELGISEKIRAQQLPVVTLIDLAQKLGYV